jgi:hypothetical protein
MPNHINFASAGNRRKARSDQSCELESQRELAALTDFPARVPFARAAVERRQIQLVSVHAFEKSAYWAAYTLTWKLRTVLVAR